MRLLFGKKGFQRHCDRLLGADANADPAPVAPVLIHNESFSICDPQDGILFRELALFFHGFRVDGARDLADITSFTRREVDV